MFSGSAYNVRFNVIDLAAIKMGHYTVRARRAVACAINIALSVFINIFIVILYSRAATKKKKRERESFGATTALAASQLAFVAFPLTCSLTETGVSHKEFFKTVFYPRLFTGLYNSAFVAGRIAGCTHRPPAEQTEWNSRA